MRAAILALVVLGIAAPAAEAAACERRADGPRWTARVLEQRLSVNVHRSTAVLCDHRHAKLTVLRRALMRGVNGNRPRGAVVGDAAAAGRRVAWIESATGRGGTRATVVVADARTRRVVSHRRALRTRRRGFAYTLEIVISTRGELAWIVQTRFGIDYETRLVLQRPGRPPRILRSAVPTGLRLEDDRTLSWNTGEATIRFLELPGRAPWPGCPERSRWRPVLTTPEMIVTRASYGGPDAIELVRACWRANRTDPVVARIFDDGSGTTPHLDVLGADGRWLVFAESEVEWRYTQGYCYPPRVFTVDVGGGGGGGGGRSARAQTPACRATFATPGDAVAVTERGSPAWIHGDLLLSRDAEGKAIELDRGDVGSLRAEGSRVLWTNGGVPREAEVP